MPGCNPCVPVSPTTLRSPHREMVPGANLSDWPREWARCESPLERGPELGFTCSGARSQTWSSRWSPPWRWLRALQKQKKQRNLHASLEAPISTPRNDQPPNLFESDLAGGRVGSPRVSTRARVNSNSPVQGLVRIAIRRAIVVTAHDGESPARAQDRHPTSLEKAKKTARGLLREGQRREPPAPQQPNPSPYPPGISYSDISGSLAGSHFYGTLRASQI